MGSRRPGGRDLSWDGRESLRQCTEKASLMGWPESSVLGGAGGTYTSGTASSVILPGLWAQVSFDQREPSSEAAGSGGDGDEGLAALCRPMPAPALAALSGAFLGLSFQPRGCPQVHMAGVLSTTPQT